MKRLLLALGTTGTLAVAACADATGPTDAGGFKLAPSLTLLSGSNTVVVREASISRRATGDAPSNTTAWTLFTRGDGTGAFVSGPATPPAGFGSFQMSTPDLTATSAKATLFNYEHIGTALSSVTAISYKTYVSTAGSNDARQAPALNIQIDKNGGALLAGDFATLVFEPVYNTDQGAVAIGSWQTWDAFNGGNGRWWMTGTSVCPPAATLCTWADVLSSYPGATIVGGLGVNQGGGNSGLVGAVDVLTVAYGGNSVTYDFEDSACHFSDAGATRTLLGDCETSTTILVPNGFTLDGNGYTITAIDPAGGHFLGSVVMNGGASANVVNLGVTARGLADVCDEGANRLRGILFEGAAGTIRNNSVHGVRQGQSGCQEGNAIEVRNQPFSTAGPDLAVTVKDNIVSNYQKSGIVTNGSVVATITGNTVTGDGPISYTAQNGIQVAFGATGVVKGNVVSGNNYTPASYVACGVLLFDADGVKASTNTLSANERDMCNYGKGGGNFKPAS